MKRLTAVLATAMFLAACGGATPTPILLEPVATPVPTVEPTLAPTAVPTARPTPTPAKPLTLEEIDEVLATKDCDIIVGLLGDDERAEVTMDVEVLDAALAALERCLTGRYVEETVLVPIGQKARVGDWDIRVTGKANFDAWKIVKAENMFNDPAPRGWKMVMFPLAVTNRSSEPMELLGLSEYVYGEGTLIERTDFDDPTCGVIPKELDFFTTIRPGGTLKGNMCFVVENADVATLRFAVPQGMFSDEPDIEFALR